MSETIVRDSAGVRIVEHAGEPTAPGTVSLSPEPLHRHGHREADYQFRFIGAAALQPDSSVVVADVGNGEVLVIARDGSLRSVLARSGQGPDEVRSVVSITVLGQDTVLVEDDQNAKLMLFADDVLARTLSTAGDYSLTRGLRVRGIDAEGRLMMTTGAYRSDFDQPWLRGHMVRFDMDSRAADTLATFDMAPRRRDPEDPFAAFGATTVSGHRFVTARGDLPELVWRDSGGNVRQIVRWRPAATFPTEEMWEARAARIRAGYPVANPGLSRQQVEQRIREQLDRYAVRYDEPLPLFGFMQGDDEGGVWLSDFATTAGALEPSHYTVVSPMGEWLGRVAMPSRFRILDVAHGLVLGVHQDELDVQSVAVYRVRLGPDPW